MKLVATAILASLFVVIVQGVFSVAQSDARDPNCVFRNSSNKTNERNKALNGYNICVTADYMDRLVSARPYPSTKIEDSIERRNLVEKLLRFNDANKIAYVTLLSDFGTVIATYTIQGKVSSNQSSLTAPQQCNNHDNEIGANCVISPGDDGSYGENEQGIFFFTTAGVLVQWNGKYLLTDAPQQITVAPVVTYNVNEKPSSAIDIGR